MKKLWLKNNDIPTLTSFSGNIDVDSLLPHIYTAQTTDIKRVLGLALYNKIDTDIQASTELTGEYKIIFDEYIVDMLVYYSCTNYMAFGGYKTANAGVYKQTVENAQVVDYREVNVLIDRYRQLASNVETTFYEYMKTITLPEFVRSTDDQHNKTIPWF